MILATTLRNDNERATHPICFRPALSHCACCHMLSNLRVVRPSRRRLASPTPTAEMSAAARDYEPARPAAGSRRRFADKLSASKGVVGCRVPKLSAI